MVRGLPPRRHHVRPRAIAVLLPGKQGLHGLLEHGLIQEDAKGAGANGRELAEHDVLAHPLQPVPLAKASRVQQDVHRLLKGAPHQRAGVLSVDAVPRDGHQVAAVGHDVAQDGEVPVVDV